MEDNFELIKDLGIIGRSESGYTKRLVLAKWYGKPPVYEVRTFTPAGRPSKRAGMTPEELVTLTEILNTVNDYQMLHISR